MLVPALYANVAALAGAAGGGPWTPTSPANAKVVWVDLTDLSTLFQDVTATIPVTASGDPVGAIKDKFTGSVFFTQATAGERPTYQANAGKPYLDLAGGTKGMITPTPLVVGDASGQHSAVTAVKFATNTGTQIALNADFSPRVSQMLRLNGGNAETIAFNTGGTAFIDAGSALAANTAYALREQTLTTATEIFVNGASGGSTAVSGTLQNGAVAVSLGDGGTFTGKIYGCVIYQGVLGSTDQAGADAYFAALM